MKSQFAIFSLGDRKILGKLETERSHNDKAGDFIYWHFSTPDYLGNRDNVITLSSCYKHIKTEEEFRDDLEKHQITI